MLTRPVWEARNSRFAPVISMLRIATIVLVIGGTLMAGPALAQFGNLFGGDQPPRPPADVPNGFPQQPPPPQYPDQTQQAYPNPDQTQQGYPNQISPAYPSQTPSAHPSQTSPAYPTAPSSAAIESQPLPPPPGAPSAVPPRPMQSYPQLPAARQPASPLAAPTQRAVAAPPPPPNSPAPPPPAAAEAPPADDTVVERPTAHIDNQRAVFAGLDKITGRTIKFDAAIGETVQFGALQVTPRACYTRPPTEATNTDAFVEVDEVTLKGEIRRIFTGWMFASSPGLNAVEHPIYDVWLIDCSSPIETSLAEPTAEPSPATPKPRRPMPASRQRPVSQPREAAPLD
jgi:hypothetical protein